MPTILNATIHDTEVVVGCYGAGSDWVCRVGYTDVFPMPVDTQAYYPPPMVGVLWLREEGGMWLASGMVNREVFRDGDTIHNLVDRIMREVVKADWQTADCVELVDTRFVCVFNGEEGALFFEGGGLRARWVATPGTNSPGSEPRRGGSQ